MNDLAAPPKAADNIPEFSVSEISGAVKRALEDRFGRVRVRGEITECKRYGSGHTYLSLKDEGAKLAAVIWKGAMGRLGLVPENGVEVIATGRVTAYGERSSYQLIIERLEYAGVGALLARIERLRLRLAGEGLFDADRKQAIPVLPALVGVVTSAQGAVLQDIRTTIARRFPRAMLVWAVPVQGEGAAARIAHAIEGMGRLPLRGDGDVRPGGPFRPDVLIVARGGGSLEDLMAFNDELVLRAAAACPIPLISAVGHETDTTLLDHVADRRAPTPTAAAEMAVPSRIALLGELAQIAARLAGGLGRARQEGRLRLDRAAGALPDLPALLGGARQRLDDRGARLVLAVPNLLAARKAALARAGHGLPDLPALLRAARASVVDRGLRLRLALPHLVAARRAALVQAERHMPDPRGLVAARVGGLRLAGAGLRAALRHAVQGRRGGSAAMLSRLSATPVQAALRERRARLEGLAARLEAVSYAAVLGRGFALVLGSGGQPVARAEEVVPGARLRLRFADGEVKATADGGKRPTRQTELPF